MEYDYSSYDDDEEYDEYDDLCPYMPSHGISVEGSHEMAMGDSGTAATAPPVVISLTPVQQLQMAIQEGDVNKVRQLMPQCVEEAMKEKSDVQATTPSQDADEDDMEDLLPPQMHVVASVSSNSTSNAAPPEIHFSNHNTPLMEACEYFIESVLLLLVSEFHVNVNYGENTATQPSQLTESAAVQGRELRGRREVEPSNATGGSALHILCSSCNMNRHLPSDISPSLTRSEAMCRYLLEHGTLVNVALLQGERNTPLHCAVEVRDRKLVALLLSSGAHVNAKNALGHTPFMVAAALGDLNLCHCLFTAGADPTHADVEGNTAVHLAQLNHFDALGDAIACLLPRCDDVMSRRLYRAWSRIHSTDTSTKETTSASNQLADGQRGGLSEVGTFCAALNLRHLIGTLEQQGISLQQLRLATDNQLQQLGVTEETDRRAILHVTSKMHKKAAAAKASAKCEYGRPLTLTDLVDVMGNSQRHVTFLGDTLLEMEENMTHNRDAYLAVARNCRRPVVCVLRDHLQRVMDSCDAVYRRLNKMHRRITNLTKDEVEPMDEISSDENEPFLSKSNSQQPLVGVSRKWFCNVTVRVVLLLVGHELLV